MLFLPPHRIKCWKYSTLCSCRLKLPLGKKFLPRILVAPICTASTTWHYFKLAFFKKKQQTKHNLINGNPNCERFCLNTCYCLGSITRVWPTVDLFILSSFVLQEVWCDWPLCPRWQPRTPSSTESSERPQLQEKYPGEPCKGQRCRGSCGRSLNASVCILFTPCYVL